MTKFKKTAFILSGIVCALGIVCMFFALMLVSFNVKALDLCGEPQELSKAYNVENVKSVSVDMFNSNVVIKQSRDERIWVTYYTTDCCPTRTELSQDSAVIVYDDFNIWEYSIKDYTKGIFHGIRKSDYETVIEIPAGCNVDIFIDTSNGRVRAENISAKNFSIHTSNGMIDTSDIAVSEELKMETSNGNITAEKITAKTIDIDTSNGYIILDDVNTDIITADTSNGKIDSSLINSDAVDFTTSNGKITVSDLKAKSRIYLDTANGPIEGNIIGKPEDYRISSGTSNGNDSLAIYNGQNMSVENTLDVYTSNGNISIQFTE